MGFGPELRSLVAINCRLLERGVATVLCLAGRKGELLYRIDEERRKDHIPAVQPYPVEEVMLDLLHTAATSLVWSDSTTIFQCISIMNILCLRCSGGVLTYLIPTTYDFGTEDLPVHPCLNLLQVCHQPLSARHGRRAVVMRKERLGDN